MTGAVVGHPLEDIAKLDSFVPPDSSKGGLMMICGLYPPTPPKNVEALAKALEKYSTMWLPVCINIS